jgi:chaperone modulatory protein CbpM
MMQLTAVVALFDDLGEPELIAWVERGWVRPEVRPHGQPDGDAAGPLFHDVDVARVRLIHDLRTAMRIDDETIPVVLSLLDQVYELRAGLRAVLRAVEAQPKAIRDAILTAID